MTVSDPSFVCEICYVLSINMCVVVDCKYRIHDCIILSRFIKGKQTTNLPHKRALICTAL